MVSFTGYRAFIDVRLLLDRLWLTSCVEVVSLIKELIDFVIYYVFSEMNEEFSLRKSNF